MRVDEATRHEVHTALEGLVGPKLAGALMTMIPSVDWDQVVTKDHLDLRLNAFEERMTLRQEALEHRMGERMAKTAAAQVRWYVGSVTMLTLAMLGSNYALVSALR